MYVCIQDVIIICESESDLEFFADCEDSSDINDGDLISDEELTDAVRYYRFIGFLVYISAVYFYCIVCLLISRLACIPAFLSLYFCVYFMYRIVLRNKR